jgi:hypothetical protein
MIYLWLQACSKEGHVCGRAWACICNFWKTIVNYKLYKVLLCIKICSHEAKSLFKMLLFEWSVSYVQLNIAIQFGLHGNTLHTGCFYNYLWFALEIFRRLIALLGISLQLGYLSLSVIVEQGLHILFCIIVSYIVGYLFSFFFFLKQFYLVICQSIHGCK